MTIKKIPKGTIIYLKKKDCDLFYLQPDRVLQNDNLYVVYDVKINGDLIIPKDTRVIGNWISESSPTVGAQLQIKKICLNNIFKDINGDSNIYDIIKFYNNFEVRNTPYFYIIGNYRNPNYNKKIIKYSYKSILLDNKDPDSIYIEIPTKEIIIYLIDDFIIEK